MSRKKWNCEVLVWLGASAATLEEKFPGATARWEVHPETYGGYESPECRLALTVFYREEKHQVAYHWLAVSAETARLDVETMHEKMVRALEETRSEPE